MTVAGICPKCGRALVGAGVCPTGDYRAPSSIQPRPSAATPSPTPSSYTPPDPVGYAPLPAPPAPSPPPYPRSFSAPSSSAYMPPAVPAPSPRQGAFGGVRIRGTIDEVGVERYESVSMAAQNAMGNAAAGLLTAIPRAIGVILGLLFAPLRMLLMPSLLAGGRRRNGPDQLQVPVTPFVLRSGDGTEYDCILRGEVRGGFLKLGEAVEVSGRDRSQPGGAG